jgi:hypothetical protein
MNQMHQFLEYIGVTIGYIVFSFILYMDIIILIPMILLILFSWNTPRIEQGTDTNLNRDKNPPRTSDLNRDKDPPRTSDYVGAIGISILSIILFIACSVSPFLFMIYVPKNGIFKYFPIIGVISIIYWYLSLKDKHFM